MNVGRDIVPSRRETLIAPSPSERVGRFTLRRVECLAACGGGPCMQVNLDYYENLDEAKVDALLEKLK